MGMKIYEVSEMFDPADYGLKAGDELNIICVGGGQGGSGNGGYGGSGGNSSFGNIVTALGGSNTTGQYINNTYSGGCGGFVPGASDWGGFGVSSLVTGTTYATSSPAPGSAGHSGSNHPFNRYEGLTAGGTSTSGGGGGYGAGGASESKNYGSGGSSGEVKYATHKIDSLTPVAVSVGGGGGGGGGAVIVFW